MTKLTDKYKNLPFTNSTNIKIPQQNLWCKDGKHWIHPGKMTWSQQCGDCKNKKFNSLYEVDDEGKTFEESSGKKDIKAPISQKDLECYKMKVISYIHRYGRSTSISAMALHTGLVINITDLPELIAAYPETFEVIDDNQRGSVQLKRA